jgi:hypothetical protein
MLGSMCIELELVNAEGDRLEGHVSSADGRVELEFSGTLDLLRAIEELRHAPIDAGPVSSREEPSPCP